MRTRMAWHLAALSVRTDEELTETTEVALSQFAGGSPHFLDLRRQYLEGVAMQRTPAAMMTRVRPRPLLRM